VKRIYQWLSQRASFFHSQTSGRGTSGTSRTIRTEVTVERQGMTLLVGGAAFTYFHVIMRPLGVSNSNDTSGT